MSEHTKLPFFEVGGYGYVSADFLTYPRVGVIKPTGLIPTMRVKLIEQLNTALLVQFPFGSGIGSDLEGVENLVFIPWQYYIAEPFSYGYKTPQMPTKQAMFFNLKMTGHLLPPRSTWARRTDWWVYRAIRRKWLRSTELTEDSKEELMRLADTAEKIKRPHLRPRRPRKRAASYGLPSPMLVQGQKTRFRKFSVPKQGAAQKRRMDDNDRDRTAYIQRNKSRLVLRWRGKK